METDASSPERRFASLLDRVERREHLDVDELRDVARLHRLHLACLARERERDVDPERVRTLNDLCVRAHALLHVPPRPPRARSRSAFFDALQGTWPAIVLATVLLGIGGIVGLALGLRDPMAVHALVPASLGYDGPHLDRLLRSAGARSDFFDRERVPIGRNAMFGASLFANNTRVGLLAFASGLLAGIPTIVLTLYNGLLLGTFASIFVRDPFPVAFFAWILPHGVPELTALVLCGAGGLVFGSAVAVPGRVGRRAAILEATKAAFALAALAIPLLGVAAFIESFVRESALGTAPRLIVAVVQVGLVAGMLRLTRAPRVDHDEPLGWIRALQSGAERSER